VLIQDTTWKVPEKPERLRAVMRGLHALDSDLKAFGIGGLEMENLTTSAAMNEALTAHIEANKTAVGLAGGANLLNQLPTDDGPTLKRSESVAFLEQFVARAIRAVHSTTYLSHLSKTVSEASDTKLSRSLSRDGTESAGDTYASARSLHAAVCATQVVCKAVQQVLQKRYRNAFCAVRPPGHHAGTHGGTIKEGTGVPSPTQTTTTASKVEEEDGSTVNNDVPPEGCEHCGQGFCLLNNAAVAAQYALDYHRDKVRKVAIIDIDCHHGNGTQEVTMADDRVLFCSIHVAGAGIYPETGKKYEKEASLVNVPLPKLTDGAKYLKQFESLILPPVAEFKPDLILLSTGFDAHEKDPMRLLSLSTETFGEITKRVMTLADQVCDGRVVSILEGGYNEDALGACVYNHVEALVTHTSEAKIAEVQQRKMRGKRKIPINAEKSPPKRMLPGGAMDSPMHVHVNPQPPPYPGGAMDSLMHVHVNPQPPPYPGGAMDSPRMSHGGITLLAELSLKLCNAEDAASAGLASLPKSIPLREGAHTVLGRLGHLKMDPENKSKLISRQHARL